MSLRNKPGLPYGSAVAAAMWVAVCAAPAVAAEKITYLLPAPPSLPAFAPWVLAKHLGYYTEAGYDVDFVVARGGVDVAADRGGQCPDRRSNRRHPHHRSQQRGEGSRLMAAAP